MGVGDTRSVRLGAVEARGRVTVRNRRKPAGLPKRQTLYVRSVVDFVIE